MESEITELFMTDLNTKAPALVENVLWFLGGEEVPAGVTGYRMLWSREGGDTDGVDVFHLYVIRSRSLSLFEYSSGGELLFIVIPLSRVTRVVEHHKGDILEVIIEFDSDVRRSVATGVILNRQVPVAGGVESSEPAQSVTMQMTENRSVYALAENVSSPEAVVLQIFIASLRRALEAL
jgi:hypothetical protein